MPAADRKVGGGIKVEGLRFGYRTGNFELAIPSLFVAAGERLACIGPSGSGKTTFLHLLAGILVPDRGAVDTGGICWSLLGDRARRRKRLGNIGLVFQEFELLDHLSVRENVLLPCYLHPGLRVDAGVLARMRDLVDAAGIGDHLDRRPRDLSHGERQRVAICRALVTQPGVVLADEPTGNLDPETTGRVLDLLVTQAQEREATLVMVTHDHSLLDAFDRVVDFRDFLAPRGGVS